jgi:SWI/SNF-related matrix-associated actin-dependent regulator 1 of chromatin subfamily A
MRGIVGRGKLKAVLAWIENFLHSGEKLVVFATHVDVQRAIYERFKAQSVLLTGEVGIKLRKLAVTKFQTDPGVRLAVCSIKAAGVGVTLTAASNVLFAELDWTPAAHDQAADRVHRIGQRSAVNIWYIVARGTIDDRMMTLVQDKRNVTGVAISGRQAKRNVLASVRG